MKSNLNVYAIQNNIEELKKALEQLKKGFNYVYSNCMFSIQLGKQEIKTRQFDTFLYNQESDTLIMLMRKGLVNKEDIIKYLKLKNKTFAEITFIPLEDENYKSSREIPELYFAREKIKVLEALKESIEKGNNYCKYYPDLIGRFYLNYITIDSKTIDIDGRLIKGLLQLDDKIILLINQVYNIDNNGNSRNMNNTEIMSLLNELDMKTSVYYNEEPKLYTKKRI